MPETIPDLWPSDILVPNVLTPGAILGYQASQLRQKTKGLLEADVETVPAGNRLIAHNFSLIAPVLDRYRYHLFTAKHQDTLVYPVTVTAESFPLVDIPGGGQRREKAATTQEEFLALIKGVLNSPDAKSVIQSLIAKSNEAKQPTAN